MVTICGGKWTTYRHMAEDCVNQAATLARLPEKPCVTGHLNIHGFHPRQEIRPAVCVRLRRARGAGIGKSDPGLAEPLDTALPYTGAEVVWAARHEMARTVEDVLARRTRALFLNARAALAWRRAGCPAGARIGSGCRMAGAPGGRVRPHRRKLYIAVTSGRREKRRKRPKYLRRAG